MTHICGTRGRWVNQWYIPQSGMDWPLIYRPRLYVLCVRCRFFQLTFKSAEPKALNESRLVSKAVDSAADDKCVKSFGDHIARPHIQYVEWEGQDDMWWAPLQQCIPLNIPMVLGSLCLIYLQNSQTEISCVKLFMLVLVASRQCQHCELEPGVSFTNIDWMT